MKKKKVIEISSEQLEQESLKEFKKAHKGHKVKYE